MKQIKSVIHEDGSVETEGHGFVGPECDKYMDKLNKELGKVTHTRKKPEYYQREIRTQKVGA